MAATSSNREAALGAARLIEDHKGEDTVVLDISEVSAIRGLLHHFHRAQQRPPGGAAPRAERLPPRARHPAPEPAQEPGGKRMAAPGLRGSSSFT